MNSKLDEILRRENFFDEMRLRHSGAVTMNEKTKRKLRALGYTK
jgi:hypothetical protein